MKRIAFIAHSFHKTTKSANVYIDELFGDKSKFEVDIFYNYEWGPEGQYKKFDRRIENYDAVIIHQLISFNLLRNINCKNIIFNPMYDYSRNFSIQRWLPSAGLKIISPVMAMGHKISSIGLSSFSYKFYPEVEEYNIPKFDNVYFWNRVEKIDYQTVLKLLGNYEYSKINIHKATDPGNNPPLPNKNEIEKYNFTFTDWFETKGDYLSHLSNFGIYIAPRPFEGGASAFIDALKLGYIVIAPDLPPFNEYIDHAKNGFLYDLNNPKPVQLEDFNLEMISKTAFESVKKGREDFKASLPAIHEYIFNDENFTYPTNYFENLEKVFEDPWYRFGILANKDKIKIFFRFIFSKVKNRF